MSDFLTIVAAAAFGNVIGVVIGTATIQRGKTPLIVHIQGATVRFCASCGQPVISVLEPPKEAGSPSETPPG